jgi:glutaredoxin-dependent peroxiredoxin
MLNIGNQAPDFTLIDTERKPISLANYKGQSVLLLFFPAAFTSTCTAELCQTRDDIAYYSGLNTAVLGISVDMPFTLAKFKEDQQLNFPLLSDFNKSVSKAYDSFYEHWILGLDGVSKRSAFVIDKNGILVHQEILENAGHVPNFEAIKLALEQSSH